MSTSAAIGMKLADGSVQAIRVNWDGYPGHVGTILAGWYKEPERINALLDLGELSCLGERLDSSDPNQGDLTIAYGRDFEEAEMCPAQTFASVDEYYNNGESRMSADYLYLYEDGRWLVYGLYNDPDWIEMQVIIEKEN